MSAERHKMKKFNLRLVVLKKESDAPAVMITETTRRYTSMRYAKSAVRQLANRKLNAFINAFGNKYHILCRIENSDGIILCLDIDRKSAGATYCKESGRWELADSTTDEIIIRNLNVGNGYDLDWNIIEKQAAQYGYSVC